MAKRVSRCILTVGLSSGLSAASDRLARGPGSGEEMRLSVPKHRLESWQLDLGLATQLISADGELTRVNVWQRRAILAVAYAVKTARLHGATPNGGERLFMRRQRRGAVERRSISVRLGDLDVFAPAASLDLSIHDQFSHFAAAVPKARISDLVEWAPPFVASDERTGQMRVYANQLTTGLAKHLAPTHTVAARRFARSPVHQLSFQEVGSLVLHVFRDFIDRNGDLLCRLSRTSAEARLLTGKSVNTAALLRKQLGVLEL